jgi:large subunit ribosomal protein L23
VVDRSANKVQIRQAVEKMYGVKVESVNTQQYVGKVKTRNTTRGIAIGRVNRSKRAFVTLKNGEAIDFYANI